MIELKSVDKIYSHGEHEEIGVLKNISFSVKENEFSLLTGPSGSGKSTILSIVGGLSKPTNGEVIIDNKSIAKLPDKFSALLRREKIGFIFQKFNLINNLSAIDNITIPLIPTKISKSEIEQRAEKIMTELSIFNKRDVLVEKLSGGEQQRVAIARALVNEPKIILADEPTANLDKKLSLDFIQIIKQLKDAGKTILLASHDPLFTDLDCINNIIKIHLGEIQ